MDFSLLNNSSIIENLAERVELARRNKRLTVEELCERGGIGTTSYKRFVNQHKEGSTIQTILGILRGLGELNTLEKILPIDNDYSPAGKNAEPPKRVFKKRKTQEEVVWGDEK